MFALPSPQDLPEGTETIVKVQWPYSREGALVLVHAENLRHIRTLPADQLPTWLYQEFDPGTITYAWAVIRQQEWDFVMAAPTQVW